MSENITCPYEDNCPNVLKSENKIDLLSQKIDLQNQHMNDKLDEVISDVREIKLFLNEGLDKRIDSRINIALDKAQAKMFRWCLGALLGSGGLSALIAFLIK